MPVKSWKLIAHNAPSAPAPHLEISDRDLPGLGKARIVKDTLAGGLSEGVVAIGIDNGRLRIEILPTRGMGIWRVLPLGDAELPTVGWRSPVRGPVHPAFVDLGEPSGLGWLDGFDELLARCGLESNGAPDFDARTGRLLYPLHGRIANKPAHDCELTVDTDQQEISLRGAVEETRFHFLKLRMTTTITTKLGSSSFSVRDEIENFSASPATMQMLYHVNFGLPLLDPGSRIVAPVKRVVPRNARAAGGIQTWDSYAAPEPGFEEMVYFLELNAGENGSTRVLLQNAHATRGVTLLFDKRQLPWFTVWKNTTAAADGYVTGLEPGTNFPNPRTFETATNRVVQLAAGQKQVFDLTMEIHTSPREVSGSAAAVSKIQSGFPPAQILNQPQPEWCA